MPTAPSIAVIVGSLRQASFTRRVAEALVKLSPNGFSYSFVDIGALPIYNQDLDDGNDPPAQWNAFREVVRPADGVLFATPEHNRSVPAALKNCLDVGSRPYGKSVWNAKPAGIVSVSPGAMGGFGANHHLRQMLVFLNMPAMAQPEAYLGNAANMIADDRTVVSEGTDKFLRTFMSAFESWVVKNAAARVVGK